MRVMHRRLKLNVAFELISIEQHGFVFSKACVTYLLECLDLITDALHKHQKLDVLYSDFIKAYDKVSDLKLINKLRAFGFGCKLINWISALLIGR